MSSAPRLVVSLLLPPLLLAIGACLPSQRAHAVNPPVVEGFDGGVNNWRDGASAELSFVPAGGPDGSSYASTSFNLQNVAGGEPGSREASRILVRGRTFAVPGFGELVASDGAFFGDWLDEVGELRFSVRHNTPEDLYFFARIALPTNSPAVGVDYPVAVPPNEWTELVVPIDLSSPLLVPQGFGTPESLFQNVFSNVGNVQFGIYAPTSLGGIDQDYSLDIDNITLTRVPEPATMAVAGLVGCGWMVFRRTRRRQQA